MSNINFSAGIDTSQATGGLNTLMGALGNLSTTSLATFAGLQEVGSGLEDLGGKILSAVGSAVNSAIQIQTLQANLTATGYNFGESLGQNQAQAKAMTDELMKMATAMKLPTTAVLQLARQVVSFGYSGQQIPLVTRAFAELASVAGVSVTTLAPMLNKVTQQLHIPVNQITNFTSALFRTFQQSSGGVSGIANMSDRLGTLAATTGLTAQEFIALAADAQNVDARIGRGGAATALSDVGAAIDKALGNPSLVQSQNLFRFLGVEGPKQIAALGHAWQTNPFGTIDDFLKRFASSSGRGSQVNAQNLLSNMGLSSQAIVQGISELAGTTKGSKTLDSYLGLANAGWQSSTDVQTAYQATLNTTASNMIGLKDSITQLDTKLSADLLPLMSDGAHVAQFFASTIGLIPAPVLAVAAGLATLAGGAFLGLGIIVRLGTAISTIGPKLEKIRAARAGGKTPPSEGGGPVEGEGAGAAAATESDTASTEANTEARTANAEAIAVQNEQLAMLDEKLAVTDAATAESTAQLSLFGEGASTMTVEAGTAAVAVDELAASEAVASGASTGMLAGVGGLAGAMGPLGLAIAATTALLIAYQIAMHHATTEGHQAAANFEKQFSSDSVDGLNKAIDQTNKKIDDLSHKRSGILGTILGGAANELNPIIGLGVNNIATGKSRAEVNALRNDVKGLQTEFTAAKAVSQNVFGDTSGDHLNQVLQAATQNSINLATGGKQAQQSLEQLMSVNVNTSFSNSMQQNQQLLDSVGAAATNYASDVMQVEQADLAVAQAQLQVDQAYQEYQNLANQIADAQNKVDEANTQVAASGYATAQAVIQQGESYRQLAAYSAAVVDAQAKVDESNQQAASSAIAVIQAQMAASQASKEQQLGLASASLTYAQSITQQRVAATQLAAAQWNLYKLGADYATQYQQALNSVADTTLSLQSAQLSAANAQWQLTYLQSEGASSRDIQLAQLALAQANQQVTDTQTNLTAAQQQANQMPTDHALAMAQAQEALAQAQEQVKSSAIAEQQAQIALSNAQKNAANNIAVRQAVIALKEAIDRQKESTYGIITANNSLANLQDGSVQLQYQQAVLNVTAAQQKEKDASYQVITAQIALNQLLSGSVQLRYRAAVLQLNQAVLQQSSAANKLRSDTSAMNGTTLSAYVQAHNLAVMLSKSTNPAIADMGNKILASLGNFDGLNSNMSAVAGLSDTAARKILGLAAALGISAGSAQDLLNNLDSVGSSIATGLGGALNTLGKSIGLPGFAVGGYITSPTIGMIGEAGPELILPLNNMSRTMQLLQQAGLADAQGSPRGLTSPNRVSNHSSTVTTNSTTNHFYLQAITQPAEPEEIMDAFAWKQRLVLT